MCYNRLMNGYNIEKFKECITKHYVQKLYEATKDVGNDPEAVFFFCSRDTFRLRMEDVLELFELSGEVVVMEIKPGVIKDPDFTQWFHDTFDCFRAVAFTDSMGTDKIAICPISSNAVALGSVIRL